MASPAPSDQGRMTHRFLGDSGLLVSRFGLGGWMNYDEKYTADAWYELMKVAFESGINFFDTAEVYGQGQSEIHFGEAITKGIADGVWSREDLVISTKIFGGFKPIGRGGPNDQGLGRKHIIEGTKNSLKRLQLDYVDVIFCHRPEPFTPIEETVRAMNFVIEQGWAFYWGTSMWSTAAFIEACEIADRLGLIRPIVEQAQYNLLERSKVDYEFQPLYEKYKLGLTTWSPLAFGTLTGKYSHGARPEGSRFTDPVMLKMMHGLDDMADMADRLQPVADELGVPLAQLAIAWCLSNERVSTVLLGAKNPAQLQENLRALALVDKVTPEIKAKLDGIVDFKPKLGVNDFLTTVRAKHLK